MTKGGNDYGGDMSEGDRRHMGSQSQDKTEKDGTLNLARSDVQMLKVLISRARHSAYIDWSQLSPSAYIPSFLDTIGLGAGRDATVSQADHIDPDNAA
jgi:hypothetical protein